MHVHLPPVFVLQSVAIRIRPLQFAHKPRTNTRARAPSHACAAWHAHTRPAFALNHHSYVATGGRELLVLDAGSGKVGDLLLLEFRVLVKEKKGEKDVIIVMDGSLVEVILSGCYSHSTLLVLHVLLVLS